MEDARDQTSAGECAHEWQVTEVVLEVNAADTISTCRRCGATGYEAGQGRTTRPPLPDIQLTRGELPS